MESLLKKKVKAAEWVMEKVAHPQKQEKAVKDRDKERVKDKVKDRDKDKVRVKVKERDKEKVMEKVMVKVKEKTGTEKDKVMVDKKAAKKVNPLLNNN